jgi:hypothetical protein
MATAADSVVTVGRGAFPALGAKVGVVEATINLATVSAELVAQGDGELVATDIIQAISLPAGTMVLAAGMQVVTAIAGATVMTLDLGITGGDVDMFVDGFDAVTGGYSAAPVTVPQTHMITAADSIDILVASQTGSLTAGVVRVWAAIVDAASLAG